LTEFVQDTLLNFLQSALFAFALCASQGAIACEMEHVYEDWPPYIYHDAAGVLRGLDIELVSAIFKEAGCTLLTHAQIPSVRRDLLFKQGKIRLILGASDIPERRAYARFSVAYRYESIGLFSAPSKYAQYARLRDFKQIEQSPVTLLVPSVGWYGPSYAQALAPLKAQQRLRPFGTLDQAVRMFALGRADLIMGDAAGIVHLAAQAKVEVKALPYVVSAAPVHLMLSRAGTTDADLERIDAAIVRLEKRGVLKAIRAAYGELP
jgi:polar amino acid transport system substrate-binding protein